MPEKLKCSLVETKEQRHSTLALKQSSKFHLTYRSPQVSTNVLSRSWNERSQEKGGGGERTTLLARSLPMSRGTKN